MNAMNVSKIPEYDLRKSHESEAITIKQCIAAIKKCTFQGHVFY